MTTIPPAQPAAEDEPIYRRRKPAGWNHFVLAVVLLIALLLIAAAFPFVWMAYRHKSIRSAGTALSTVVGSGSGAGGMVWPNGIAPANVVLTSTIQWPEGGSMLEKWANRTPGKGTAFGYYMTKIDKLGYAWSEGLALPIEGESVWVVLAEWPRGDPIATPREMRLSLAKLVGQPNGDVMPQSQPGAAECFLSARFAKVVMDHGVPDGLMQDFKTAATSGGSGGLSGSRSAWGGVTFNADKHFVGPWAPTDDAPDSNAESQP